MYGLLAAAIIASLSMFVPGILLAFALLRKTELHSFEIAVLGIAFGLVAPATLTWLESYLMFSIHAFSFSLPLFEANAVLLTIIGAALCYREGAFKDLSRFIRREKVQIQEAVQVQEVSAPAEGHAEGHVEGHHRPRKKTHLLVWVILAAIMLITFATRMQSISTAPKFFEFDPYFDMFDAQYILTYGHQLLLDPSAWPVVAAGTNHRIQPIVPYLEAYWYSLANALKFHYTTFSTSLMSYVGGIYPPITAALLVFVIFLLLYHEYDHIIGLIGAGLTATMPVLFTTFIAGEQLLEPWGIFSLFLFFATYMLAIRNPKSKRLAVLAGLGFASTFLGAHYYTVTAGVLTLYILIEGIINVLRSESLKDFYKMNAIVLAVAVFFYLLYAPYEATLESNLSSVFGIPVLIAAPVFALVLIAFLDFVPKELAKRNIVFKDVNFASNLAFMIAVFVVVGALLMFTPLGRPLMNYIELSTRFTTPSKALFMTVQEFIPTGPLYNFASAGFGAIGANTFGIPLLVWLICGLSIFMIALSIGLRKSKTGVLYISVALPLMAAGFSEVKYLPHMGVAYILLFGIILGEAMFALKSNYYHAHGERRRELVLLVAALLAIVALLVSFSLYSFEVQDTIALAILFILLLIALVYLTHSHIAGEHHYDFNAIYSEHRLGVESIISLGLFFVFGFWFLVVAAAFVLLYRYGMKKSTSKSDGYLLILYAALAVFVFTAPHVLMAGEASSIYSAVAAQATYMTNAANACTTIANSGNNIGYSLYCNTIAPYWLDAMSWLHQNVGPYAPRVLAWWDYGDWINWFGNTNAVLRGDNSVAKQDYAVAAQLVLGPNYNSTPESLASYMNTNQSKYLLVDYDLVSKWQALDFLACININATSLDFAESQGALQNPPLPYLLGSSQCELTHDPQFALLPLAALLPSNFSSQQSLSNYCSISSSKNPLISAYLVSGNSVSNHTVCVNSTPNSNGVLTVYNTSGGKMNAVIQSSAYLGVVNVGGTQFVEYLMIYLPGANGTVENPPSEFYTSNYYRAFFLGSLPGFTQVYPDNATGINLVNGTYKVRIFSLDNFTGSLPPVPAKPSWIRNNYTMP